MLWEVLWPLAFGFLLSAIIQTVVSKRAVAGGLGMAVILWILFKVTLRQRMVDAARRPAERGVFGSTHDAHGEMDVSITDGPFLSRIFSPRGFTAISHAFFMDLNALYVDLGL